MLEVRITVLSETLSLENRLGLIITGTQANMSFASKNSPLMLGKSVVACDGFLLLIYTSFDIGNQDVCQFVGINLAHILIYKHWYPTLKMNF